MSKKRDQAIVDIALQLMKERPGRSAKNALKEAADIFEKRGAYKLPVVAERGKPRDGKRGPVPEHIALTMEKQRKASADRENAGRSLPSARIFQGGSISKK